jgi:hypothetical protein
MSPVVRQEALVYRRILTLLALLAVVTVSGCLGLLWLRQKIESTAQATRLLETDIVKEERRIRYIDTKIAEIHQPIYLERQIRRLGLPLLPPRSDQIVYLDRVLRHMHGLAGGDSAATKKRERDPFRHSIDLAVMESLTSLD